MTSTTNTPTRLTRILRRLVPWLFRLIDRRSDRKAAKGAKAISGHNVPLAFAPHTTMDYREVAYRHLLHLAGNCHSALGKAIENRRVVYGRTPTFREVEAHLRALRPARTRPNPASRPSYVAPVWPTPPQSSTASLQEAKAATSCACRSPTCRERGCASLREDEQRRRGEARRYADTSDSFSSFTTGLAAGMMADSVVKAVQHASGAYGSSSSDTNGSSYSSGGDYGSSSYDSGSSSSFD